MSSSQGATAEDYEKWLNNYLANHESIKAKLSGSQQLANALRHNTELSAKYEDKDKMSYMRDLDSKNTRDSEGLGFELSPPSDINHAHVPYIATHSDVRNWMYNDDFPGVLVINGNEKKIEGFPSVTYWTNSIMDWYRNPANPKLDHQLGLDWTCSQFPEGDAEHLIIYILGELLFLGSLDKPKPIDGDPSTFSFDDKLRLLVHWMYHQLETTEIVLVIDCIDLYLDAERKPDLQRLFDLLANIAGDSTKHPFRFCVTSPVGTGIAATVDRKVVVNVPEF